MGLLVELRIRHLTVVQHSGGLSQVQVLDVDVLKLQARHGYQVERSRAGVIEVEVGRGRGRVDRARAGRAVVKDAFFAVGVVRGDGRQVHLGWSLGRFTGGWVGVGRRHQVVEGRVGRVHLSWGRGFERFKIWSRFGRRV